MLNALLWRAENPAQKPQLVLVATATVIALIGALAAYASMGSSKYSLVMAGLLAVSPVAVYLAITRPIVFPFGLFALLLPFDNVMSMSSFGTLTKLLGGASALALLLYALRTKGFVSPPKVVWLWVALLFWMGASIYWALDADQATQKYYTYAMVIGLYWIMSCVRVPGRDLRIALGAVLVGGVLAAAYGSYYYYLNPASDLTGTGQRLIVQLGESSIDPNHFADALALPMAIALGLVLRTRLSVQKVLYAACILLLFAGYYFASSRGAFLGLLAMLLYFFWRSRQRMQLLPIFAIGAILSGFLGTTLWARFSDVMASGGAGRTSIWAVGLAALKQHWLLGAGVGNFQAAYNAQYLNVFQTYANPTWGRVAHNLIIQSSVEFGIIGLLLVLCAWAAQLYTLRIISEKDRLFDLRVALEAAVVGLFIGSLSVDMLWYKYLWECFIFVSLLRNYALYEHAPT